MSHVYILTHKSRKFIKIGKANNVAQRIKTIGKSHFDLSNVCVVRCSDERHARDVESVLHKTFSNHSTRHDDLPDDGYTEWFDSKCFESVLSFVGNNIEQFNVEIETNVDVTNEIYNKDSSKYCCKAVEEDVSLYNTFDLPSLLHSLNVTPVNIDIDETGRYVLECCISDKDDTDNVCHSLISGSGERLSRNHAVNYFCVSCDHDTGSVWLHFLPDQYLTEKCLDQLLGIVEQIA